MNTYGEKHHAALYSDETVELARALNDEGIGPTEIANKLELSVNTVREWTRYRTRINTTAYRTIRRREKVSRE